MPGECISALNVRAGGTYVDATTGGGGHSLLIARRLGPEGRLICLDRDSDALEAARQRLNEYSARVTYVKTNFQDIEQALASAGAEKVNGLLFDLGVSSWQLDNPDRGFSYMNDAPLDMRMDRQSALSAWNVVNEYSKQQLQIIISGYGEERYAARIAGAIEEYRRQKPIESTLELTEIIKSAMPAAAKREKQHPAKRTFQAIRIEVNGELEAVEKAVEAGIDMLAPSGRIAVISFHSLEDRIVKQVYARRAQGCICPKEFPVCVCGKQPEIRLTPKGAVTASAREVETNPRARSAKLRVAEKI